MFSLPQKTTNCSNSNKMDDYSPYLSTFNWNEFDTVNQEMDYPTVTSPWSSELNFLSDLPNIKQGVEEESSFSCSQCAKFGCTGCTDKLGLENKRLDENAKTVELANEKLSQKWLSPLNTPEYRPEWDDTNNDIYQCLRDDDETPMMPEYIPPFITDNDDEGKMAGKDVNPVVETTQRPLSPEADHSVPLPKQAKPKLSLYPCTVEGCGRAYQSRYGYYQHQVVHSGKFTCLECNKSCQSNNHLQKHQLTHCSKKVGIIENLVIRPIDEHTLSLDSTLYPNQPTSYQCNISGCDRVFTSKNTYYSHQVIHSGRFTCPQCSRSFHSNYHLQNHQLTHTNERPHQCTYCCNTFTQKSALTAHLLTHSKKKPLKCIHCNKTFAHIANLTIHMRVHTGDRPYKCPHCSFAFTTKSNLNTHLRLHADQPLPFQCQHCSKRFNMKQHMTIHVRNNHR